MDTYKAKQLLLRLIDDNLVGTPDDADLLDAKAVVDDMFYVTKEDVVYAVTRADLEDIAGRKLSEDEYYSAKKEVESGFGEVWMDVAGTAVHDATSDEHLDHPEEPEPTKDTCLVEGVTYVYEYAQMREPDMAALKRFYGGRRVHVKKVAGMFGKAVYEVWAEDEEEE